MLALVELFGSRLEPVLLLFAIFEILYFALAAVLDDGKFTGVVDL